MGIHLILHSTNDAAKRLIGGVIGLPFGSLADMDGTSYDSSSDSRSSPQMGGVGARGAVMGGEHV